MKGRRRSLLWREAQSALSAVAALLLGLAIASGPVALGIATLPHNVFFGCAVAVLAASYLVLRWGRRVGSASVGRRRRG